MARWTSENVHSDFRLEGQLAGQEARKRPTQPFGGRMGRPGLGIIKGTERRGQI